MANDIPDLSGADFRDAGAAVLHTGAALAGVNANANPDEAARAAQLGAATGVPSNVIHLDPKAFEDQLRQRVTQGIVGGNESLAHYAGSDPMASIVSNDDWGTLDTLSGKLHALRQATDVLTQPFQAAAEGLVKGGLEGLKEGWGEAPPVTGEDVTKAIPALDPNRSLMGGMENTLLSSVMNAAQLGLRGMSSLFEGTTGAIGGAVGGLAGEAAGREAKALAEYEMMKPEQMPGGPWLMAGHEPPAGISKDLDKAKVERNETLLKGLEDAAAVVQQSKTWERSPELFKQFVQQHLGDRSISIAGDAVTALYGKEVPAPGDGKLGWVPNIASKVLAAAVDGSDVEVPLADWLTHMDPAVAKGLHDNIRMWPEGVTKAEAGVERQQVLPPPTPDAVNQVRAAGGLEPVFRKGPEPASVTKPQLRVAFRQPDGEIKIGEPGQIHAELMTEHDYARVDHEHDIGFATPEGKYLTRAEALEYTKANEPERAEDVAGYGIDSSVYHGRAQSVGAARSDHPMIIGLDTIDPKAVGLPEGHWQKLQELAQAQYEDDMSLAQRRADRQAKQRETTEWKANRKEMQAEVEAELRAQPHVAADLFLGSGELNGEKLQQRFTLREGDLNDAQKAALPSHYVSKNGLGVDDVASLFGYGSGDSLVDALAAHHALKAGRSAQEMLAAMVKGETDRRMEAKYGDLPSNILTAAHDQALSETTLNLVTQEYQGALMAAQAKGLKVDGIDPGMVKEEAKRIADGISNKDVNSRKKLAEVSKNYSDAVKGLLGSDPQATVIALQRRAIGAHVARELLDREQANAKFDKLAGKYAKRWDPRAADQPVHPDWSLYIRDILGRIGLKDGMGRAWMQQEITNSRFTGLEDFVNKMEKESIVDLQLPVPDFLYNSKVKPYKEMDGEESRAVQNIVSRMDAIGRADMKAEYAGQKLTKEEWIAKARAQLAQKFDPLDARRKVGPGGLLAAASTNMETVFSRWDGRDPHGLFTRTFTYPMAEGTNFENRLQREEGEKYRARGEIPNRNKQIDSPIIDPQTGEPWKNFTRANLHAVIANIGNEYNWKIACKGWGVDPDLMWKWVEAHTDVKDIEHAQDRGNQFQNLKSRIDVLDRNLYGVASESVIPRPFIMHGKQFEGWYHPVIGDSILSRIVNKMPKLEADPAGFWPSVYNKFLKKRTGAVQFISLDLDAVPARMSQEIHYLAMHEPVMNAAKLIRDDRFRGDVIKYYGKEYLETLDSWLRNCAGEASVNSAMMAQANKWSGIVRQNVVNTQIAFNVGTVEKHGPTALMYSLRELAPRTVVAAIPSFAHATAEVAPGLFKHAVMDLFGKSPVLGDSWFDFIIKHSEEIQRRVRNYQDTLLGSHQMLNEGWSLRQSVFNYGAKMVAFSDMLSAAPLWLARYRQEMALHGDHGLAIQAADYSVRRAHGSTATSARPMIVTGNNPVTPWLTTLYGFMGTSMNRRIEIMHDVNDFYKLGRRGDINGAAKMLPQILTGLAVYVAWTGYVEEKVTGQFTDDRRGALQHAASYISTALANSIIGLRDLNSSIQRGGDSVGLLSTPPADAARVLRDMKLDKALGGHYNPLAKQNAGKLVQDTCTLIGDLSGLCPKHVGTVMRYGMDAFTGVQKAQSAKDVYEGLITGSEKPYIKR